MLTEIIRELTKSDENMIILDECVLTWAKRAEAQKAQVVVINSLHELKNFDAILQMDKGRERQNQPHLWKCLQEEDANTAVRNTNWDSAWHMGRSVKNATK